MSINITLRDVVDDNIQLTSSEIEHIIAIIARKCSIYTQLVLRQKLTRGRLISCHWYYRLDIRPTVEYTPTWDCQDEIKIIRRSILND